MLIAATAAFVASGFLALMAALIELLDGDLGDWEFLPIGFGSLAIGGVMATRIGKPSRPPGAAILTAIVCGFAFLAAISTGIYLLTGATTRLDNALFESVSGYSTTGLTVLSPVETQSHGVLFWRAGTQWVGGLAGIVIGVILLPFWVSGRELSDLGGRSVGFKALAPSPLVGLRRIGELYGILTFASIGAFALAGMPWFDAVTYGMTTISTGGFANHSNSLAAFDSGAIEWVATIIMFIAGSSIVIIWRSVTGAIGSLASAFELRVYVAITALASLGFGMAERVAAIDIGETAPSFGTALRHGALSATSAMSTTGHRVAEWNDWATGPKTVMFFLFLTGSMAGSIGGGYRWLRLIEALKFARRELTIQLHPRSVSVVKVGDNAATESSLAQMNAHQILVMVCAGVGAFGLAALGVDLLTALSLSVSSLSTFGPSLGELGAFGDARMLSAPARMVAALLMLAGRVSIYPIMIALGSAVLGARRLWR